MIEPQPADLEAIQGLVYTSWNDHRYAGFLFATLGPDRQASRDWLDKLRREISPVTHRGRKLRGRLQLAIAPSGLRALDVPDDVIGMMPSEALAGMASRRQSLGDTDPKTWQLGGRPGALDVLVMVYACDPDARAGRLAEQRAALVAAGATVLPDELGWPMESREHFGFADGLSQPYLPGLHQAPRRGEDAIAAGEVLLGYPNAYDQLPISPLWGNFNLGHNGTYLVFRKLAQDVAGLWGWIAQHARRLADGDAALAAQLTDLIGAKLMGRWRSGAPLTLSPDHDDLALAARDRVNAFKYLAHDPDGLRCPISSHVRRANPRDARGGTAAESEMVVNRHRILRRGRSYGAPMPYETAVTGHDDRVDRGLYFISLQASIARGFEFIQQSWLANPGFAGLHVEPDPIIGNGNGITHISIPAEPVRLRLGNVPTVVHNLGGDYFFLPSLPALERIAKGPGAG